MEQYQIKRNIICIDLKSFFATVECVLRGLDPFTTPLVVADESRGGGAIALAVSPYLKTKGVPSRLRLFELPKGMDVIIARPQMQQYLNYSAMVIEVYLEFISEEDLYVYSIDEAFLDVTGYLNYYQMTDYELAEKILKRITEKTKMYATAGIGPNMLLAKVALDVESKFSSNFIAKWTYEDVKTKLWEIKPLSKMWGIGARMEEHLNILGLHKVGDIANFNVKLLKKRFGILGEELYYHTHGIDMSLISEKLTTPRVRKSYGVGQVLFRSYEGHEVVLILREMVDDITRRLRLAKKRSRTIALGVGYTKEDGGGFNRQLKLEQASNNNIVIYEAVMQLFNKFYDGSLIRRLSISASNLTDSKNYQYSIFEDANLLDKEEDLQVSIDILKQKYGKNIVNRASSELSHSTVKVRNKLIGGHHEWGI